MNTQTWNPQNILNELETRRNTLQREANQISAAITELRKVETYNFGNSLAAKVDASFPPAMDDTERLAFVRRAVQNTGVPIREKLARIMKGRKRMSTNEIADLALARGVMSRRDFGSDESFKASIFHHLDQLAQEGKAKRFRPEGGTRAGAYWQVQ